MPPTVQARCPGCQKVLRIPADWLSQTVKCKFCATVLQAQPRAAAAGRVAPAVPPPGRNEPPTLELALDSTSPSAALSSSPFDLSAAEGVPGSGLRRRAHRRGSKTAMVVSFLIVGLILAGGMTAAVVYFKNAKPPSEPGPADPGSPPGTAGNMPPGNVELPPTTGPFPRRIMAVSVSNYLYANPLNYGDEGANARQPLRHDLNSLLNRLADNWRIPREQRFEVSDQAPDKQARPPLREVMKKSIESYLDTCRPQDHIILLFAGHAVEVGNETYLVPLEGDLANKDTLIPLKWVYEKLAACKAQQKVFIVDICRYDPGRGEERPGSGPMKPGVEKALKEPPAGVQVLASCSAGQYSYEYDYAFTDGLNIKGSVFLNAFFAALMKGGKGISKPEEPLPVPQLAEAVIATTRQCVQNLEKKDQTAFLSGLAPTTGAPYNPNEPPAVAASIPPPTGLQGGTPANREDIRSIFLELDVPPIKASKVSSSTKLDEVIPFSADVIGKYKLDVPISEIRMNPKQYPLRVATLDAFELLNRFRKEAGALPEELRSDMDDKSKAELLKGQKKESLAIFEFKEVLDKLEEAGQSRKNEKSARWQAHYDYAKAQVEARLAYLYEYQLMFGKARRAEMPTLDAKLNQKGWRLASQEKLQSTSDEVKDLAKDSRKLLDKLVREHAGTPWEIAARRERFTALGLQWQPTSFQ
jgi:hypothetical protein